MRAFALLCMMDSNGVTETTPRRSTSRLCQQCYMEPLLALSRPPPPSLWKLSGQRSPCCACTRLQQALHVAAYGCREHMLMCYTPTKLCKADSGRWPDLQAKDDGGYCKGWHMGCTHLHCTTGRLAQPLQGSWLDMGQAGSPICCHLSGLRQAQGAA